MIRPLGDRIVVKPIPQEEKTRGGIFLPETAKEKPQEGKVVAVGPGRVLDSGDRVKIDVKVDDRVLYSKYAGNEVKIDGEEYVILREMDVLGVVEQH
ncbi:MAG: co-chaperone GroES [Peptococcaceae bacterium]|nr:co-chaperone GroES [Peptococcaceae bacterium]